MTSSRSIRRATVPAPRLDLRIIEHVVEDPSSDWPATRTMVRYLRCSVSSFVLPSKYTMPSTALRGVRISWLMLATKSLFARLAASARSRSCSSSAARDSSSCCRRSRSLIRPLNASVSSPISSRCCTGTGVKRLPLVRRASRVLRRRTSGDSRRTVTQPSTLRPAAKRVLHIHRLYSPSTVLSIRHGGGGATARSPISALEGC